MREVCFTRDIYPPLCRLSPLPLLFSWTTLPTSPSPSIPSPANAKPTPTTPATHPTSSAHNLPLPSTNSPQIPQNSRRLSLYKLIPPHFGGLRKMATPPLILLCPPPPHHPHPPHLSSRTVPREQSVLV